MAGDGRLSRVGRHRHEVLPTTIDFSQTIPLNFCPPCVTIEAKRLLGLPSRIGLESPYYMILSVDGISKTTDKISQKDGGVKWDQKLSFNTEITDSSVFRLELFHASRIRGKDNHSIVSAYGFDHIDFTVKLKVEDRGTHLVQIYLLVHGHIDPRTEMKTQVGYAQRMAEGLDLENHLTAAESVTSIVHNVSKGGRKTAEMINTWKPVWSKFDALIKLSEKIAEIHPYAKLAASVLLSAYNVWLHLL
ncbi:hypothetical protein M422DRAFT_253712 [Sphaerobolus stellatus SS14]|uniref:C2 domain-containing protein n=1 Tax=Sphaerobolus stellatus (strain SS14) TaxID=990650 RepID=A0A0C9VW58_SPHS4|nr:hypothetical protein M422DRAFT_253712 [Sphaerobolus stellatus SS14]